MNLMPVDYVFYNGDRIKEIRERTGLSQTEFSRLYDIPVGTYRNWEQHRTVMPDYVFELLHRAISVDEESICDCLPEELNLKDGWKAYYKHYMKNYND